MSEREKTLGQRHEQRRAEIPQTGEKLAFEEWWRKLEGSLTSPDEPVNLSALGVPQRVLFCSARGDQISNIEDSVNGEVRIIDQLFGNVTNFERSKVLGNKLYAEIKPFSAPYLKDLLYPGSGARITNRVTETYYCQLGPEKYAALEIWCDPTKDPDEDPSARQPEDIALYLIDSIPSTEHDAIPAA